MKNKFLALVCIIFSTVSFANENFCLSHIDDHLRQIAPDQYELDLADCKLNDADMPALNNIFKTYPGIIDVTLDKNNIGEKGIQALEGIDNVLDFSIDDNLLGDQGLKVLLSKSGGIFQLSVNRNKITNQSIPLLTQSKVRWLSLAGNNISDASSLIGKEKLNLNFNPLTLYSLLKLGRSTSLNTLYIAGTRLSESVLMALRDNQYIEDLDISETKIGDAGIKTLSNNWVIVSLHVNKDQISDIGIQQGLANMRGLRYLFFSGNNITAVGVKALPYGNLELLDLSNNNIGDKGVQALGGDKIQGLILDNNKVQSKESTKYLANHLPSLWSLSLSNNQLGVLGARELVKRSISSLYMDNNQLGNEGAIILAQNVTNVISMSSNAIDDNGVRKFEPLLSKSLFKLDVRKNKISSVGVQLLKNHQPKINNLYTDEPTETCENKLKEYFAYRNHSSPKLLSRFKKWVLLHN